MIQSSPAYVVTNISTTILPVLKVNDKKYAGVAVTLMLPVTPKWFQRRYSMMVQNIYNNIPADWQIQIFYTGKGQSRAGIEINPGLQRMIEEKKVVLTVLPEYLMKARKIHIMLHPWFWENVLADKVLIFGGNQVICSNSLYTINDFIQYDYIGSPWSHKQGVGGDGGISIRSRPHMLQIIYHELSKYKDDDPEKPKAYTTWGMEDSFMVSKMVEMSKDMKMNVNIAPKDVTYQFGAINNYANLTVWTASGILPDISFQQRDEFLAYCPEIKLIYPSLHDPNCFGASPNAEECAKSICALQPKSEHPGGC